MVSHGGRYRDPLVYWRGGVAFARDAEWVLGVLNQCCRGGDVLLLSAGVHHFDVCASHDAIGAQQSHLSALLGPNTSIEGIVHARWRWEQ